jgi:hypothetical protein
MTSTLARRLDALADWRRALDRAVEQFSVFLDDHELRDASAAAQIDALRQRLASDRLVLAFVAEFSRGKSELINAIFFADAGRRVLPATPGRTTMCPVELSWNAEVAPGVSLLPIDTRLKAVSLAELRERPEMWRRIELPVLEPAQLAEARAEVKRTIHVSLDEARLLVLERRAPTGQPAPVVRWFGRGAGLAPRVDQLPAPAAQARSRGHRHAGPQRDRRRTRTDARPAAVGPRHGVHPRRGHRCHQV